MFPPKLLLFPRACPGSDVASVAAHGRRAVAAGAVPRGQRRPWGARRSTRRCASRGTRARRASPATRPASAARRGGRARGDRVGRADGRAAPGGGGRARARPLAPAPSAPPPRVPYGARPPTPRPDIAGTPERPVVVCVRPTRGHHHPAPIFLRPGAVRPSVPPFAPISPDADAALAEDGSDGGGEPFVEEDARARPPEGRSSSRVGGRGRLRRGARPLQEEEDASFTEPPRLGPRPNQPLDDAPPPASQGVVPPGHCSSLRSPERRVPRRARPVHAGRWHAGCFTCAGCGRPISRASHAMRRRAAVPRRVPPRAVPTPSVACAANRTRTTRRGHRRWLTHPYWGTAYCRSTRRTARGGATGATAWNRGETDEDGRKNLETRNHLGAFAELPDGRASAWSARRPPSSARGRTRRRCTTTCARSWRRWASGSVRGDAPAVAARRADGARGAGPWRGVARGPRLERPAALCVCSRNTWCTRWNGITTRRQARWWFSRRHKFPWRDLERRSPASVTRPRKGGARGGRHPIVLYGLPAVAAGAVLAHECTHAHIRSRGGTPGSSPRVEEAVSARRPAVGGEGGERRRGEGGRRRGTGVGSGSEEHYSFPGEKSASIAAPSPCGRGGREANLAAMAGYVANQIRTDPSEVYGDGLRAALASYRRHGLTAVFAHVKATGRVTSPVKREARLVLGSGSRGGRRDGATGSSRNPDRFVPHRPPARRFAIPPCVIFTNHLVVVRSCACLSCVSLRDPRPSPSRPFRALSTPRPPRSSLHRVRPFGDNASRVSCT